MRNYNTMSNICFLVDCVTHNGMQHYCVPVTLTFPVWIAPNIKPPFNEVREQIDEKEVWIASITYVPGDWTKQELAGMAEGNYRLPEETLYYEAPSFIEGTPYREACALYKSTFTRHWNKADSPASTIG